MPEVVGAHDLGICIGKEGKGEPEFLRMTPAYLRWIHADGDYTDAGRVKIGDLLLETP